MNQHLNAILTKIPKQTILVIGDVMLDEYHWCDVSRISPEAPVPVCRVNETTLVPGGASNVANNLHSLGAQVHLVGAIGQDSSGDKLKAVLSNLDINTEGLIQTNDRPTILKSRIVAGQQHIVRVDREDSSPISSKIQKQLLHFVETHLHQYTAVIISDYLKGTLPDRFLKKLIALVNQHKLPIVVDPKGQDYNKYKEATILTPNFKEFTDITKKRYNTEQQIHNEAIKLQQRLKLSSLLVTRSEKGMSLIDQDRNKHDIPTRAREVYDITGAGDTVISVLAASLATGAPELDAAKLANVAAGIVVAKIGTSTVTITEIEHELQLEEVH